MFANWKLVIGICLVFGAWSLVITSVGALGGPAPQPKGGGPAAAAGVLVIEDFESGNLKSPREWWTFDIAQAAPVPNGELKAGDSAVAGQTGNYSLLFKGKANNWYAGGGGTYVAKEKQDLAVYNSLRLDVYGQGPGSGTLKIEIFDDDNNNWQAEQDAANNYVPVYDDKYVYDVRVDWHGWKRVVIPLDDFVDDNQGVGDDIWNPEQKGGSGGLLQIQLICLGPKESSEVNFNVDNIVLTASEE